MYTHVRLLTYMYMYKNYKCTCTCNSLSVNQFTNNPLGRHTSTCTCIVDTNIHVHVGNSSITDTILHVPFHNYQLLSLIHLKVLQTVLVSFYSSFALTLPFHTIFYSPTRVKNNNWYMYIVCTVFDQINAQAFIFYKAPLTMCWNSWYQPCIQNKNFLWSLQCPVSFKSSIKRCDQW